MMEPAFILPALLPLGADSGLVEPLLELSSEETALRHRLELRVERAFDAILIGSHRQSNCVQLFQLLYQKNLVSVDTPSL